MSYGTGRINPRSRVVQYEPAPEPKRAEFKAIDRLNHQTDVRNRGGQFLISWQTPAACLVKLPTYQAERRIERGEPVLVALYETVIKGGGRSVASLDYSRRIQPF